MGQPLSIERMHVQKTCAIAWLVYSESWVGEQLDSIPAQRKCGGSDSCNTKTTPESKTYERI